MRFAAIATLAAAAIAVPAAVGAAGPQMAGEQFLEAVRCTALEDITRPEAELGLVKMQLNAEARRQPTKTAAQARAEVSAIARIAVAADGVAARAALGRQRTSCSAHARVATSGARARGSA